MTNRTTRGRGVSSRRTVLATGVSALVAGLAGCDSTGRAGSAGGPATIRFVWWGDDERAKATRNAVALFEKRHPTITVRTEVSAYDAYFAKLTTELTGKSAPDLLQIDRTNLMEYGALDALLDLGRYLPAAPFQDVSPAVRGGDRWDATGALYGQPAGQTTQMLVYDPAMFARAGVTVPAGRWAWARFADDMARVKVATGTAGVTDFGGTIDWFEVWLQQRGKSLYADGRPGFTAADLSAFWTMTGQMRARGAMSAPAAVTAPDGPVTSSPLVARQAAAELSYDSSLAGYLAAYGAPLKTTTVPSDGPGTGMCLMPSVSYAIARRTAHRDATIKLLTFLLTDRDAGELLGATRGLPAGLDARARVCASAYHADSKPACDHEDSVHGVAGPAFALWPKGAATVKRDFRAAYDGVILGGVGIPDAARRVVDGAAAALRR